MEKKYTLRGLKNALTRKFSKFEVETKNGFVFVHLSDTHTAQYILSLYCFTQNIKDAKISENKIADDAIYYTIIIPYNSIIFR